MKIKHIIVIILFVVLAISAGWYLKTKDHSSKVKLENTQPKTVLENYYDLLNKRDGRNIANGMLPYEKYKRWYLFDSNNRPIARLTAEMMKNMKSINVKRIEQVDYNGSPIEFTKRDNSVEQFKLENTVMFEVTYDVNYFNTNNKSVMYSEYNNKDYKDTHNSKFENQKEKVWLVKMKDGSWKIAKFRQEIQS